MQYSIRYYLRRFISISPHKMIVKVTYKAMSKAKAYCNRKHDQRFPSFLLEEIQP